MSVIRKKPFIEMVIDSLSPAMKDALAGVLNNQPATINRDSSFADMPSVNTVTAVYFKLDETNFKNGILIYNSSYCVLVAYHRFQDLLIYQLNVAAKQYAKINEYLDINELRRVLNDRVGKDIDAGEIDSGDAVEGQVLAADGAGGADWIDVMDAITPETVQEGDAVQLFGFNSQGQLVKDNMPEGITVDQSVIEDSPNAVSGGAVYDELEPMKEDIDALEADMENKANKDGNYPTLTAGLADNLNTKIVQNEVEAYLLRTTGGSLEVGNNCKEKAIVGGSLGFNQLIKGDFSSGIPTGWFIARATLTNSGNVAILSPSSGDGYSEFTYKTVAGHKYMALASIKCNQSGGRIKCYAYYDNLGAYKVSQDCDTNSWVDVKLVFSASVDASNSIFRFINPSNMYTEGYTYSFKEPMIIDLTAMFGTTIADYIYSLETGTAGAGVAWFRKYFNKPYYPYTAIGGFIHVKTSGKKVVGFNQAKSISVNATAGGWAHVMYADGELLPNTTYCISFIGAAGNDLVLNEEVFTGWTNFQATGSRQFVLGTTRADVSKANARQYYPGNGWDLFKNNSSNAVVPSFQDVCINFHYDGERDGEFEEYHEEIYENDDIELIGIPHIDEGGNLYFDGNKYLPDGTVEVEWKQITPTSLISNYQGMLGDTIGVVATDAVSVANSQEENFNPNIFATRGAVITWGDRQYAGNWTGGDVSVAIVTSNRIAICVKGITTASALTTWLANNPISIVYLKQTPTEDSATAYPEVQACNNWGTEQRIDNRDVPIPVGHDTDYPLDLKSKLEIMPDLPSNDGYYVCKVASGTAEYVALGAWLSSNGWIKLTDISGYDSEKTQTLKNVNGVLTWVDD